MRLLIGLDLEVKLVFGGNLMIESKQNRNEISPKSGQVYGNPGFREKYGGYIPLACLAGTLWFCRSSLPRRGTR